MTKPASGMLRVELDLVPDTEVIRGRARDAEGVEHAFAGWLELVEVLDRARTSHPSGISGKSTAGEEGEPR